MSSHKHRSKGRRKGGEVPGGREMLTCEEACLWEKHSRQREEKEPHIPGGGAVSDTFKAQQDKGWVRKQSEGKKR